MQAQQERMVMEKPGTFKITSDDLIGFGPDSYGKHCTFTKADEQAAKKNLNALISIFRETPVLANPMGFDGIAHLNISTCNTKFGYGLPCTVYVVFQTWLIRKGKEVKQTIEPPQFRFNVNRTDLFCSAGFNVESYLNSEYNATNPAYKSESINKAALALRELFFLPGIMQQISPGINRYGDNVVIFNPNRPVYWEQVTIREAFRLLIEYWKLVPDKIAMDAMLKVLNDEYASFTEEERNGFAYFGSPESISRIGSQQNNTPVMRPNPAYWNKSLPQSAIQFMVLEIPEKEVLKTKMEDCLKRQDGGYYVSRLLYELDIDKLPTIIDK
jgi:hypothetical protein